MPSYPIKPAWPHLNRGHRLARGLVRAFALAEAGGTQLADLSTARANLTFATAPTRGAGPWGRTTRLTSPASGSSAGLPLGAADRTVSLLMLSPPSGTYSTILGYGDSAINQAFRLYRWTDDSVMLDIWYDNLTTGLPVADDAWHHVAATIQGRSATLYVDGKAVASHFFSNLNTTAAGITQLVIGAVPEQYPTPSYTDWLDSVKIWDRALSPAEVAADAADPFAVFRPRSLRAARLAAPPGDGPVASPKRWFPGLVRRPRARFR